MMELWQAIVEEDAYGRVFIFLQLGDNLGTRELFDAKLSEEVEDLGFEREIGQLAFAAKIEADRRNASKVN